MHKTLLTTALLALAAGAHATDEFTNSLLEGYVHGKNHCYAFTPPQGWTMDNTALAAVGVPMTFLPVEQPGLSNARIYTRPGDGDARDPQGAIRRQVEGTIALYKDEAKQPNAVKEADVTGKDGARGELWHYTGYPTPGAEEMVVYFPGKQTLNFFVLQLGQGADSTAGKAALLELAASYYERDNCQPCSAEPQSGCQNPAK